MTTFEEATARDWVVDLATHRVRRRGVSVADGWPVRDSKGEVSEMADGKARDQARRQLNPIEDIKGAARYLKDLDPIEKIEEFMETAAKVLEPSEADLRLVEVEDDTVSELEEPGERGRRPRPVSANPQPDVKALNKEHRGY